MKVYGAPAHHYAIHIQLEEIDAKLRADSALAAGGPISEVVNMFKAPRMSYRIALGMTLQMFQQLTGANYFFCESSPNPFPSTTTSTACPSKLNLGFNIKDDVSNRGLAY